MRGARAPGSLMMKATLRLRGSWRHWVGGIAGDEEVEISDQKTGHQEGMRPDSSRHTF